MIGYLARTFAVGLRANLGSDGRLVSRISLRVMPRQIDLNLHMNQAQYPAVFELGRTDWFLRIGAWKKWRAQGINPMVAEQTIIYRHELKPFTRYIIDTRVVGVEGRFVISESYIIVGEKVHTKAIIKIMFVGPKGVLSPEEVRELSEWTWTEPLKVEKWRVQPALQA